MQNDINLPAGVWHNLYSASGIATGTSLLVYNKGLASIVLWDEALPPSGDDGAPCLPDGYVVVEGSPDGCWVKSHAAIKVNVQAYL